MPVNTKAMGPAALSALVAAWALSACGSSEEPTTEPQASLSPATAERLAAASDQVADELESGKTCAAAHSADELDAAVSDADIPEELRPDVEAASDQLVNEVNCKPVVEGEPKEKKKPEEEKYSKERLDPGSIPDEDDKEPPGLAKKDAAGG